MSEALKVLGQVSPAASSLTPLYTAGSALGATASSIVICNTTGSSVTINVSVAIGGAADATQQYLYSGLTVAPNDTFIATIGITMAQTDQIRCWASAVGVAFNLFGVEES